MDRNTKALITAALGGLVLAATVSASYAEGAAAGADGGAGADKTGECHGINSCKGTGACGGEGHSCAGMNTCKGKGWVKTTKAECDAKKGTFKE